MSLLAAVLLMLAPGAARAEDGGGLAGFLERAKEIQVAEPPAKSAKTGKPAFFAKLPERFTPAADDPLETALLNEAAARGVIEWFDVSRDVVILGKTYTVTVPVSNALTIDGVRINLRYDIAQRLADKKGWLLPTPAVAQMARKASTVRFPAQFGPMQEDVKAGTNVTVSAMIKHSRLVDEQVAGRTGLADNEGKWFVLSRKFWTEPGAKAKSGIYGWWWPSGSPIQTEILAHELPFADYSQVVRFMGATATVKPEGKDAYTKPTADILTGDGGLGQLLSDEGALPDARHPGVPKP